MPTLIQNVIATRSMIWTRADGATFPVHVYVGDLVFIASTDPDLSDYWQASTQVLGPSIDDSVATCGGDDSVQALYHALFRAGDILSSSIIASQIDYSVIPNFGFPLLTDHIPLPPPNAG